MRETNSDETLNIKKLYSMIFSFEQSKYEPKRLSTDWKDWKGNYFGISWDVSRLFRRGGREA